MYGSKKQRSRVRMMQTLSSLPFMLEITTLLMILDLPAARPCGVHVLMQCVRVAAAGRATSGENSVDMEVLRNCSKVGYVESLVAIVADYNISNDISTHVSYQHFHMCLT